MTARFNALAREVFEARRREANPVYREPHKPMNDDFRLGRITAAAQLHSAGFTLHESRSIAAHAAAGTAVAGDADAFKGVMARAWATARGERPLPNHPGFEKSACWLALEAAPRWTGKGYGEARSA